MYCINALHSSSLVLLLLSQCNEAASACEDLCKLYPVYFSIKGLTRKITDWSLVLPKFMRDLGNKLLRLEQEVEHLHNELNSLDRSQTQTLFKAKRYYDMLSLVSFYRYVT